MQSLPPGLAARCVRNAPRLSRRERKRPQADQTADDEGAVESIVSDEHAGEKRAGALRGGLYGGVSAKPSPAPIARREIGDRRRRDRTEERCGVAMHAPESEEPR